MEVDSECKNIEFLLEKRFILPKTAIFYSEFIRATSLVNHNEVILSVAVQIGVGWWAKKLLFSVEIVK